MASNSHQLQETRGRNWRPRAIQFRLMRRAMRKGKTNPQSSHRGISQLSRSTRRRVLWSTARFALTYGDQSPENENGVSISKQRSTAVAMLQSFDRCRRPARRTRSRPRSATRLGHPSAPLDCRCRGLERHRCLLGSRGPVPVRRSRSRFH